jgi:hypothetical protein
MRGTAWFPIPSDCPDVQKRRETALDRCSAQLGPGNDGLLGHAVGGHTAGYQSRFMRGEREPDLEGGIPVFALACVKHPGELGQLT